MLKQVLILADVSGFQNENSPILSVQMFTIAQNCKTRSDIIRNCQTHEGHVSFDENNKFYTICPRYIKLYLHGEKHLNVYKEIKLRLLFSYNRFSK